MNELNTTDYALTQTEYRDRLLTVERAICAQPQVEIPVKHYFVNGMYAREIVIPKGTVLTGAIHLTEHLCVMNGDLTVSSEKGTRRLTGYHMFTSYPGEKRIGYAHEDTIFTTLHATPITTVKEVEEALVVKSYEEYNQAMLAKQESLLIGESK